MAILAVISRHLLSAIIIILISIPSLTIFPSVKAENLYSAQELEAVEKFRPMVADVLYRDYMHTDKYLIKWIRSTKQNLDKANEKLRKAHSWRRENEVDSIQNEDFSKIHKQCPTYTNVLDRKGQPVFVVSLGKCDARKIALSAPRKRNQRYLMKILESLSSQVYLNPASRNASQCGLVADVGGFNLRQHACLTCFAFYVDFVVFYEAYYPETAKYVISVNTPRIIETTFTNLLSPFASESTVFGLKGYGLDKEEWSKELNKLISADQLTREFGGTRRSFDD